MRRITAHPADSENFPISKQGAVAEFAIGALNRRLALIGAPLDG